ncbi:hypothetical protein NH340_JMT04241 [Sarcoptes scabiei]|nr:hypothetical protein NH340_JMT04241 [Sarcoptes scabiei]
MYSTSYWNHNDRNYSYEMNHFKPKRKHRLNWFDQAVIRFQIEFRKISTFRIIIIAFVLHSLFSIVLIHSYLNHFNDTYYSKHTADHIHPDKGKISIHSKRQTKDDIDSDLQYKLNRIDFSDPKIFGPKSVNLLSSNLIKSHELTNIGWFSDHYRWEEKFQCYNSRWTLCDKIYIAKCRSNVIRAIYQFVPFKKKSDVRHLFFSLRATSEQLIEQSNDGFFGLLALIEFNDGTDDLVRLQFQYESETWSLRTKDYRSYSRSIRSVTLMLVCYGYTGIISFTDVRLSSESVGLDPMVSAFEIGSWCSKDPSDYDYYQQDQLMQYDYEILKTPKSDNQHHQNRPQTNKHYLTFVSQLSLDRLSILESSLSTWNGPVSIVIFVPIDNSTKKIQDWQRLYIDKKISTLNVSFDLSSIILVSGFSSEYPINYMRNLAIRMAKTKFLFLIDADFQPSPALEENFIQSLRKHQPNCLLSNEDCRIAFIVPAFEYAETPKKADPILQNKEELIQLVYRDESIIEPFREFEFDFKLLSNFIFFSALGLHDSHEIHGLTDYWRWYFSNNPYNLSTKFLDKYEPYVILQKKQNLPLYDERLTNYGMNKVMHINELFAANYTFQVLDDVWVIHFQHRSTSYNQKFLTDIEYRLRNRAARFKVLKRIIVRYETPIFECEKLWV